MEALFNSILQALVEFDHALFHKINIDWSNSFFDWFFPAITDLHKNPQSLFVLIPLILFWIWKRRSKAFIWLFVLVLSIGLSDLVSYRIVKKSTERDRPEFTGIPVQLRTHQHSGTSFPSNHAANVFAAATALTFAAPPLAPVFYLVAGSVAYSRVYVGVHFPLDVSFGALLGVLMAFLVRLALSRWIKKEERRNDALGDAIIRADAIKNGEGSFRGRS